MKNPLIPVLLLAAATASAQDAVMVDPEHHEVEFENDQIRVVRMTYPVGYKTPMHGHLPGVTVSLSTATVHSWSSSGEESDGGAEFGTASWSNGNAVHANQVTGDSPLELIRVEIKKNGTTPIPTPSHDTVKVDPDHHKVEVENDEVRVVRWSYPAGYETPLHNHLPGITITLTDNRMQATYESGRKSDSNPIPRGNASDLGEGSEPHRTKNLGSDAIGIRVELKKKI